MNKPAEKKPNWYDRLPVKAQAAIVISVVLFALFVLPFLIMFPPTLGSADTSQNLSTVPYPSTETLAWEDVTTSQYSEEILCAEIDVWEDAEKFEEAIKQAPEWKRVSSLPPDVTEWLYGENGALHFPHQKALYPRDGYYIYKGYGIENETLENFYASNKGTNRLENMEYIQYAPNTRELTFISSFPV